MVIETLRYVTAVMDMNNARNIEKSKYDVQEPFFILLLPIDFFSQSVHVDDHYKQQMMQISSSIYSVIDVQRRKYLVLQQFQLNSNKIHFKINMLCIWCSFFFLSISLCLRKNEGVLCT